jgi:hypothetical protein
MNKPNKKLNNNLLKECDSNSIKLDKALFLKLRLKNEESEYEKKKNLDSEQNSISGYETENHSKSNSNMFEKDEKVLIQIERKKVKKKINNNHFSMFMLI